MSQSFFRLRRMPKPGKPLFWGKAIKLKNMHCGGFSVRCRFISVYSNNLHCSFSCFAENLPYFHKDVDLSFGYVTDGVERHITAVQLNLIGAYMLHALAGSQSMGKLSHAFKNVRNMDKFLHENAAPPFGTEQILTRETMSYAISLSISSVTFNAGADNSKGKASAADISKPASQYVVFISDTYSSNMN